jgi:ParB-like chromosome segregation protein Spo0J
MRRSLKKWGQYKNVVVDDQFLVLAGNGLVEAMRAEGMKKVTAVIMYELSENDKKKLMMADNKTAGLGIDNLNNIEALIGELAGDFDIPGFDDEVLNSISAASDEISQALDDYGKATEENLNEIDAHANVNDEDSNNSGDNSNGSGNISNEAERKCVKCPECGADVWL